MALFNTGKRKEEKKTVSCCCSSESKGKETSSCCASPAKSGTTIKVLGAGCKSCHDQYESVKTAVNSLGLSMEVEYITNMETVMAYGVMSMPAIVINEQVVSMGKVLKSTDVEKLLHKMGY